MAKKTTRKGLMDNISVDEPEVDISSTQVQKVLSGAKLKAVEPTSTAGRGRPKSKIPPRKKKLISIPEKHNEALENELARRGSGSINDLILEAVFKYYIDSSENN